jgi:hypothetical protein
MTRKAGQVVAVEHLGEVVVSIVRLRPINNSHASWTGSMTRVYPETDQEKMQFRSRMRYGGLLGTHVSPPVALETRRGTSFVKVLID